MQRRMQDGETLVMMLYVLKMICNAFITLHEYTDEQTMLPVAPLKVKGSFVCRFIRARLGNYSYFGFKSLKQ